MIRLAAVGLATWRLTQMLHDEPGPFAIFDRMRVMIGPVKIFDKGADTDGAIIGFRDQKGLRGEAARAVDCTWCLSIWTGLALVILDRIAPAIIHLLAASAVSMLVEDVQRALQSTYGQSRDRDVAAPE